MGQQRVKAARWKLESFLYFLIRDHLPIGKVDKIMYDMRKLEEAELITYSSKHIQEFANEIMEELILESFQEKPK